MPSSHLRMEEATSIIASKSISDGFGRTDIDDLDDFVLQIDENEINNEIKANGLLEDVAIEVFKKMENSEEKTIEPLKTIVDSEELMNCETNNEPDERTVEKSCDLEDKQQDQAIPTESNNGLCEKKNSDVEAETDSQKVSETDLKSDKTISVVSDKTDTLENNIINKETVEASNDDVIVKEEEDKTSMKSSDITEESTELNLDEPVKTNLVEKIEETNEFIVENLDTVDKELDSLLTMEEDISSDQPDNISEPMDVDSPPRKLAVIKITTIQHPPSIALELQNQVEKMDSDSDCSNDPNSAPDSPPSIILHSPRTVTELDGNSSICDGFLKEKTVNRFSKKNKTDETDKETKEEFIYHTVKHIQISAQSNVFKENNNSEKRLKRVADEETNNDQKKIKLNLEENEENRTRQLNDNNDLEDMNELNPAKKLKKDSDTQSESSCDSGSSTGSESGSDSDSDSCDESGDTNGANTLNEIKQIRPLVPIEIPPETLKEIMEGREKLFANYFEGKTDITINRYVLEEMVMTQMIEMITYRSDVGQLRQKCRVLENEQIRMNQKVYALKKQAENARLIIKKLIDEKTNNKAWTQTAIPLKVTRSVGLQVCTCGSMTVRNSKSFEKDSNPPKNDKVVNDDSTNINSNSVSNGDSDLNKKEDNKENISTNIEKDVPNNKDSNNTDDVVIVSVTENNSNMSSNVMDKSNNLTVKKNVEPSKNGIVSTEKVVRKPLGVEHTNSPTIQNKTPIVPNSKKLATDDPLAEKESSPTKKTAVSEIIDLTDKEDNPVKKLEESSKSVSASVSSEKNATGIVEKSRKTISSQPSPLVAVNGIKKSPATTSPAIRKSLDIAPAADLVNSYDHLPKYPVSPKYPPNVTKPPRPILRIGKNTSGKQGIMLSWSFEGGRNPQNIEEYQLYAYQESKNSEKLKTDTWKKVGDIKALPLPMACFLTQFVEGHKYHFIVRAVDTQKRLGDFSLPGSIILHAAGQPPSAS